MFIFIPYILYLYVNLHLSNNILYIILCLHVCVLCALMYVFCMCVCMDACICKCACMYTSVCVYVFTSVRMYQIHV